MRSSVACFRSGHSDGYTCQDVPAWQEAPAERCAAKKKTEKACHRDQTSESAPCSRTATCHQTRQQVRETSSSFPFFRFSTKPRLNASALIVLIVLIDLWGRFFSCNLQAQIFFCIIWSLAVDFGSYFFFFYSVFVSVISFANVVVIFILNNCSLVI